MPVPTTDLLNDWAPDVGQFTDAVGGVHIPYEAAAAAPVYDPALHLATFAGAQGALSSVPLAAPPKQNTHVMVARVENELGGFYAAFTHALNQLISMSLIPKTAVSGVQTTFFVQVARGSGLNTFIPQVAPPALYSLGIVDDWVNETIYFYINGVRRGQMTLGQAFDNNGVPATVYVGRNPAGGSRLVGSVGRMLRYGTNQSDGWMRALHETLRTEQYPALAASLGGVGPLYNISAVSILGGKYRALSSAKQLEEQVTAEMLLKLTEPVYTGADGEKIALAIAHQLNFQLELGINALTLRTLASGHAGQQTEYRDRIVSPIAHAMVRQVTGAVSVGFEIPPG